MIALNSNLEPLIEGAKRLGLALTPTGLRDFQTYYEELSAWNTRVNLTAITDYNEVRLKHFLDSLTVASALPSPVPAGYKIIDIGSGAGFPGLPLKIAFPQIELTLLEATGKKADFLRHVTKRLSLETVTVINVRAEEAAHLPQYREHFDAVLSRGVASMGALAELTIPFCAIGGLAIAQKKGDIADEISHSLRAIDLLGGRLLEVKPVDLPGLDDRRCLVITEKVSATPSMYPRRPGIPAKKPLH